MNGAQPFSKELTGRIILIVLAVGSSLARWWLPILVAPLFWQGWDIATRRGSRILDPVPKLIADSLTWILWLGYMIYSIVSFGLNIGHWYGWGIGIVVGLVVAQFLGLLWPHRWHLEKVEDDL